MAAPPTNTKPRKSSASCLFSLFGIFKARDSRRRRDDAMVAMEDTRKVWPSDGDKGKHWVAEPGIDRKAKAYIDRIYQIRFSETECQTHTEPVD